MKKMLSLVLASLLGLTYGVPGSAYAANAEVQSLVDLLVSKNIISSTEATGIIQEAEKIAAAEKEELKSEVAKVSELPKWVTATTFSGDFRLRYQYESRENASGSGARHRERYRLRFGFVSEITDTLKVGFRLASGGTGGSSIRSTNQSFDNNFDKDPIGIDKAYFEWQPYEQMRLIGGKFNNEAIFTTDDLLWDDDITWEGQMINLNYGLGEGVKGFFNGGLLIVEEDLGGLNSGSEDPIVWVMQPGVELKTEGGVGVKSGVAFYVWRNLEGKTRLTGAPTTSINSLDANGGYLNNFNVINPNIEFSYGWEGSDGEQYEAKLLGDYVLNPDADENDQGFLLGAKVGHKKIKEFGQWQAGYNFRYLERNAWLDVYPDSDAYSGNTNVTGHEFALKYGLTKNTELGLDYYWIEQISSKGQSENLIQADVVYKF